MITNIAIYHYSKLDSKSSFELEWLNLDSISWIMHWIKPSTLMLPCQHVTTGPDCRLFGDTLSLHPPCLWHSWHQTCDIFLLTCINSLGPSDAIWHWISWSTLVQVMACCLTAPSHHLNQCWLIISQVLWHSSEDTIIRRFEDTNH